MRGPYCDGPCRERELWISRTRRPAGARSGEHPAVRDAMRSGRPALVAAGGRRHPPRRHPPRRRTLRRNPGRIEFSAVATVGGRLLSAWSLLVPPPGGGGIADAAPRVRRREAGQVGAPSSGKTKRRSAVWPTRIRCRCRCRCRCAGRSPGMTCPTTPPHLPGPRLPPPHDHQDHHPGHSHLEPLRRRAVTVGVDTTNNPRQRITRAHQ